LQPGDDGHAAGKVMVAMWVYRGVSLKNVEANFPATGTFTFVVFADTFW
jgi:hypothetical protein